MKKMCSVFAVALVVASFAGAAFAANSEVPASPEIKGAEVKKEAQKPAEARKTAVLMEQKKEETKPVAVLPTPAVK